MARTEVEFKYWPVDVVIMATVQKAGIMCPDLLNSKKLAELFCCSRCGLYNRDSGTGRAEPVRKHVYTKETLLRRVEIGCKGLSITNDRDREKLPCVGKFKQPVLIKLSY